MTQDLAPLRQRYAEAITAALRPSDPRIREALAKVPREDFLGPPPWSLLGGYRARTTSDPAELYADALVTLNAEKGLNNGSPSLHALMLHRLDVQPGQRVLHVGAGGGYYTAVLAELTGPTGQVTAVEFDPALAAAAQHNMRPWPWVAVVQGDGAAFPAATTDRIYVNFALADPADAWLDHLAIGGRLLFPLGTPHRDARGAERRHSARAAVLIITRTQRGFAAAFDSEVAFVFAEGPTAGDAATQLAVYEALGRNATELVKSFSRGAVPFGRTWCSTPRWSLGCDPPP